MEPQKKAVRHFLVHERLLNLAVVGSCKKCRISDHLRHQQMDDSATCGNERNSAVITEVSNEAYAGTTKINQVPGTYVCFDKQAGHLKLIIVLS